MTTHDRSLVFLFVALGGLAGCGGGESPPPPPTDAAVDVPADIGDGGRGDAGADTGPARPSAPCMRDEDCGGPLLCSTDFAGGFCSVACTHDPQQSREQAQCGGRGTTCVAIGDGEDADAFCLATCNPTARPGSSGACAPSRVCTGWWYTHDEEEVPGCDFFCTSDAHCGSDRCNTRTGECNAEGVVTSRRADGEPCDPRLEDRTPPANQCRGICFIETDRPGEGICGSLVNLALGPACPDDPTRIHSFGPGDKNGPTDNIGLCIYKECSTDADCTRPLRCVPGTDGDPAVCTYPEAPSGDGGVPTDAPRTDSGVRSDASTATDVPRDR